MEDSLLNLSLAIVTDSSSMEKKKKRKRRDHELSLNNTAALYPRNHDEGLEGKVLRLLQLREQMLKLDHHKRKPPNINNNNNNNNDSVDDHDLDHGRGLHLIHLLLITATAVHRNEVEQALENLEELFQSVRLNGDSVQRVIAYFTDGLTAKLLTRSSPFYDTITKRPTKVEEFSAFVDLYRASPYYQFAHFTANQVIIEAFEREEEEENNNNSCRALHVIDFDVAYGFQWPSLIQSLSEKATGRRISLRITAFGRSSEELRDTESRLVSFAKGFRNLSFEFHGRLRGEDDDALMTAIRANDLTKRKRNETVAVNLVFHSMPNGAVWKIDETLKAVRSINPSVAVLVEEEGSRRSCSRNFLWRFVESLHYFAAMFDSLDDCLPMGSWERLCIEKNHLGNEIKCMLNHDGDRTVENEYSWREMMERHGFEGMRMSSKCVIQAKLLLKIRSHCYCPLQFDGENGGGGGGFNVFERDDGKAITLGWQHRFLLTASAWHCRNYIHTYVDT